MVASTKKPNSMTKLIKGLIVLALLLFPFGEIFRIDLGHDIALRPLDLVVGAVTIIFVFQCIKNRKLPSTFLTKPVLVFLLSGLISLLINIINFSSFQIIVASLYLMRFATYASIFFVVYDLDEASKSFIKKLLVIEVAIVLTLGYAQYFLYPNLRNLFYLGWDEHNYRMFAGFLDPNFSGAFFVLTLIFLYNMSRIEYLNKDIITRLVTYLLLIFTFIAIFLTYSRSAILMLITGAFIYFLAIGKKKYFYGFMILIAAIIFLLIPTFNKENTNLLRKTSSLARVESYSNAFKIIADHPLFGVGFNTYRYAQQLYRFKSTNTKFPSHADAGIDNSFIFVLATTGIFGFVAYIYLWYKILKEAKAVLISRKRQLAAVILASSVGLFINSFFINSLFYTYIMLWMWIIIGLL